MRVWVLFFYFIHFNAKESFPSSLTRVHGRSLQNDTYTNEGRVCCGINTEPIAHKGTKREREREGVGMRDTGAGILLRYHSKALLLIFSCVDKKQGNKERRLAEGTSRLSLKRWAL